MLLNTRENFKKKIPFQSHLTYMIPKLRDICLLLQAPFNCSITVFLIFLANEFYFVTKNLEQYEST